MDVELCNILRAADKHPNSRVAKLIRTVQDEPNHKNIVLLFIEIAEHNEYSMDFNIPLNYYINLFEQLGFNNDTILNEAGLFLVNAANIYVRRVDCIYDLVKQQLLSLCNADKELEEKKKQDDESLDVEDKRKDPNTSLTTKRGRKRVLDAPINHHEIELMPKKIRKLTAEKRFSLLDDQQNSNRLQMNCNRYKRSDMQQYLHPTSWLHGTIYDLENDDEIDNKRNYKMFTYHIEHRYHTLVPDINFRLHFKMKDFIDEENERLELEETNDSCHTGGRKWPPLSEAYIEQYIDLENNILGQKSYNKNIVQITKQSANLIDSDDVITNEEVDESEISHLQQQQQQQEQQDPEELQHESAITNSIDDVRNDESQQNDSTINLSDGNLSETCPSNQNSKNASEGYHSLVNSTSILNGTAQNSESFVASLKSGKDNLDDNEIDLNQIRVRLHMDDEGVYISDLDENDQKMLSPKVLATDVFPSIPHKENIRIIINDEIRTMFGITDSPTKNMESKTTTTPLLKANIFQLPEKLLKKRVLFKLGPDMKVYTEARLSKRSRIPNEATATARQKRQLQYFPLNNTDFTNVQMTPLNSPGHYSDFYGFSLDDDTDMETWRNDIDVDMDMNKSDDEMDFLGFDDTASRDSGMGIEMNAIASDSQGCEERLNLECHNNPVINAGSENINIIPEHAQNDNNHLESERSGNFEGGPSNEVAEILGERESNNEEQETEQNEVFNDLELTADSSIKTKVQEWHDYLRPILAKSRERHHFDVFELGTEIIETIQSNNSSNKKNHDNGNGNSNNNDMRMNSTEIENENTETGTESNTAIDTTSSECRTTKTATFMNIMENRDESYVSRYFLSTLLLINQGNLELIVDKKGNSDAKIGEKPIEWDEMVLKLKSTKRYSVAVEDNIGLLDKNVGNKPKLKDTNKPCSISDRRMSYSKNVSLKRAHNKKSNIIMDESEMHNKTYNCDEKKNETNATEICISSTPVHKVANYSNKRWQQLSRISNIMPLEDQRENTTATNSMHSQNNYETNTNNNDDNDEQQSCSSRIKYQISKPSIILKKIVPLPTISKSLRQHETDSGIFSNDNYQLIS